MATTAIHPEVAEEMLPWLKEGFGNPQSLHSFGVESKEAIEEARAKVATLIGGAPGEIYFTSSGTEANNFALKGLTFAHRKRGKHIIVSQIEHHSILHSAEFLETLGFEVTYLPVDKFGLVDPDDVKKVMRKDTILLSVMHANAEVGTIEPVADVARLARAKGVVVHTDAVASVGYVPVDVRELGVDALSLAGHQFYGPKGVGALWVKKGVRIVPFMHGGIQEEGRRAGTENVMGIVGLGKAATMAEKELIPQMCEVRTLRDRLMQELPRKIDRVYPTGHPHQRLPHHASFCIEFIEGESMLLHLDTVGVSASSGSACTSRALKASHVLSAMGISAELAQGSLVFGLGIQNTEEEIDYVLEVLPPIVDRLRQMSPLYAKHLKEKKDVI